LKETNACRNTPNEQHTKCGKNMCIWKTTTNIIKIYQTLIVQRYKYGK